MTVTIKIRCNNAAFAEDGGYELARILREIADRAENGAEYLDRGTVRDINGNKVGEIKLGR